MQIGIVDADLIGRTRHRFPNLACMKISGYLKEHGHSVSLITDYTDVIWYDEVYISKVFTDTPVPKWLDENFHKGDFSYCETKIHVGGTGFFFDHAPNLPIEIEHHMPDYHLYDGWLKDANVKAPKSYTDYSIGFTTRGCFRKCKFCINQKYDKVFKHSSLEEFYDPSRKKICLLDDNILGCSDWKNIISELQATGKPFKFKQGLDERLLTREKCEILFSSNYDGSYTFAFDNVEDYDLIESKLKLIREFKVNRDVIFYVLVGFKSTDAKDIEDAFKRIELLMRYKCLPYIMRYQGEHDAPWKHSRFKGMYVAIARWCNQFRFFRCLSFREFCQKCSEEGGKEYKVMQEFEFEYPEIAKKYFDLKFKGENR